VGIELPGERVREASISYLQDGAWRHANTLDSLGF